LKSHHHSLQTVLAREPLAQLLSCADLSSLVIFTVIC
jgi:hypothetical protein